MLKRIIVTSRTGMSYLDLDHWHSIISINDPGDSSPIRKRWGIEQLQILHFHDVGADGPKPMEWVHGDAVAALLSAIDQSETLVVHCFAGVSRSVSVAMAIADHLGLGRDCIDWRSGGGTSPHIDPPNEHVYSVTMASLRKVLPRKAA